MKAYQDSLPNVDTLMLEHPSMEKLTAISSSHKPRILLLYGSLRERSFSRLVIEERVETAEKVSQRVNQKSL